MRGLAAFDMDGTLLTKRTIDVLADELGLKQKLLQIDQASKGKYAYQISIEVARLFEDIPASEIIDIFDKIEVRRGAQRLIEFFKKQNFLTSIISDSYTFLLLRLAKKLHIDEIWGNTVEINAGRLTGKLTNQPCWKTSDSRCKRHSVCKLHAFESIANKHNIPMDKTIAFGDSSGDICMLRHAKVAIGIVPRNTTLAEYVDLAVEKDFDESWNDIIRLISKI
ncbi:MAG: HAD family hydrolase [Promethearchaeota archaeon]